MPTTNILKPWQKNEIDKSEPTGECSHKYIVFSAREGLFFNYKEKKTVCVYCGEPHNSAKNENS